MLFKGYCVLTSKNDVLDGHWAPIRGGNFSSNKPGGGGGNSSREMTETCRLTF